jgi:hypothetical protein
VKDYYSKPVDPEEYTGYLRHNINLCNWFGQALNAGELNSLVAGLAV